MSRSGVIVVCAACLLTLLVVGCTRTPLDVRLSRDVDEVALERLPRLGGSVVLLVDVAFWTSQERVGRIPLARREQTFTIGPGAAAMAEQMLSRMFDEVTRARYLDRVEDLQRYDFVIQLLHESFDDRNLYFLIGSRQSYRVGLGAAISRPDGPREAVVDGEGSESFWHLGLGEALPVEGKARLSKRAGQTLNKAVQESLFGLMERLAATAVLAASNR